ncbi:MAG: DNA primase [Candidatus Saccharibacteria bacterium]|nr:DNA primase [Candidatus Saccharibacteria bacterium]
MNAVDDIKDRVAIEDVVGDYVELKRSGRNYKGLSPFTGEKTASFMVSPEKQIWHDFSSGKGGNMFSFVMEMEGVEFKGALELLARKAGIDLSQYRSSQYKDSAKLKERLLKAHELATKFYQVQFSKHQDALNYVFKTRGFSKDVALEFKLGYAPNNGTALADYLTKQGFSKEEMGKAGLVSTRFKNPSDMFRGRIMVPLMDSFGKVIGFTGRILEDAHSPASEAPKYLNTPQTMLYDKGRHIFGLHLAKESIRKKKRAVMVEGNLDVIASHQAGVKEVVATAGTAMTPMHLKAIGRLTDDVRIAFDQDDAGLRAAERTIPLASQAGVNLSIITVPEGKDPDDLIKKDPSAWEKAIKKNQYALDWLIKRKKEEFDITGAEGKRRFTDSLMQTIRELKDPVEQDHYIQVLAKEINVSAEALRSKFEDAPQKTARRKKEPPPNKDEHIVQEQMKLLKIQDHLLCLILLQPALRYHIDEFGDNVLVTDQAKQLHGFLKGNQNFTGDPKEAEELKDIADYVKILGLQYEELYQGLELLELRNEVARLKLRLTDQYVKTKKATITKELETADETRTKELLEEAKRLDEMRINQ